MAFYLNIYYGSYDLEDGERAKDAKKIMREILKEVGEIVGTDLLPSE